MGGRPITVAELGRTGLADDIETGDVRRGAAAVGDDRRRRARRGSTTAASSGRTSWSAPAGVAWRRGRGLRRSRRDGGGDGGHVDRAGCDLGLADHRRGILDECARRRERTAQGDGAERVVHAEAEGLGSGRQGIVGQAAGRADDGGVARVGEGGAERHRSRRRPPRSCRNRRPSTTSSGGHSTVGFGSEAVRQQGVGGDDLEGRARWVGAADGPVEGVAQRRRRDRAAPRRWRSRPPPGRQARPRR